MQSNALSTSRNESSIKYFMIAELQVKHRDGVALDKISNLKGHIEGSLIRTSLQSTLQLLPTLCNPF